MDCLDLLAVQGTLKSLLQHHSSKASILKHSAFFIVRLSYPYMTTGKTIALTSWTFVGKVMSLLCNKLSKLVIAFLWKGKCLLISWLQSLSAVIWEPHKINFLTNTEKLLFFQYYFSNYWKNSFSINSDSFGVFIWINHPRVFLLCHLGHSSK